MSTLCHCLWMYLQFKGVLIEENSLHTTRHTSPHTEYQLTLAYWDHSCPEPIVQTTPSAAANEVVAWVAGIVGSAAWESAGDYH